MEQEQHEKTESREWIGNPAAGGLATGISFLYTPRELVLSKRTIPPGQINQEQEKVASALRVVELETRKLAQLSDGNDPGGKNKAEDILRFHREILRDPLLIAEVNERIRSDYLPADRAVFTVLRNYIQKLEVSGNRMFRERIPDIVDIRSRVIRHIQQKELIVSIPEGAVVICREINPSEMILFSRKKVSAIVAEKGGLTSHASIIAKSLGIPFVLDVEGITEHIPDGVRVIVDGNIGKVVVSPDDDQMASTHQQMELAETATKEQDSILSEPASLKCGHRIPVRLNIGLEAEIDRSHRFSPEGIGLLRTEAYFLEESDVEGDKVTGHDQRRFLERSAELVGEGVLTIRLYDVGGDKMVSPDGREQNPALGWRGVRVLLDRPALLRQQLELIITTLHAFSCDTQILIPMVSRLEEVHKVREVMESICLEKKLKPLKLGVMVEVPSAVMMAGEIARNVDFMSIGTNDLTQYTLAADRGNTRISSSYTSIHPALWRMIDMVVKACFEHNIPVSVCGEMASRPDAALILAGMKINALSMAGPAIPRVKKMFRAYTLELLQKKALHILECSTTQEVEAVLKSLHDPSV